MAEIADLLDVLIRVPNDLHKRPRSESIERGIVRWGHVLRLGLRDAGDGKLELERWSKAQIEAVLYVSKVILSSSISSTAENVEPAILAILGNSIEFCSCFLERLDFDGDDFSLQNNVVHFLEAILTDGITEDSDILQNLSPHSFVESLPDDFVDYSDVMLCNNPKCNFQGPGFPKKKPLDRVLMTLASECLQPDAPISRFTGHPSSQITNGMLSLAQHWGVFHAKCLPRLLLICKELLHPPPSPGELTMNLKFQQRNSIILRILKLLRNLTKDLPYIVFDVDLLRAVTCYVDNLVALFQHESEFIHYDTGVIIDVVETQFLLLLEEFIWLLQTIFCDGIVFQNIRTCIVAKMLDIYDVRLRRYNNMNAILKPPLAYCPKVVVYLLKIIKEVRSQTTQAFYWNEKFGTDQFGCSDFGSTAPTWNIFSETVFLLKKYTPDEHLKLLLPSSKQWLDNLIDLVLFFHSEGLKLWLKVNKLCPNHPKSVHSSDSDSTLSHEDDALFGDLFSEASRPVGSDGRSDQTDDGCTNTSSSSHHILWHAAAELLIFLKLFVFHREWSMCIYEDACKKINEHHINSLISVLSCQTCLTDGKPSDIVENCFDLLHNLLVQHALSASLEEHLVDRVLKVENGKYTYNDYMLTLVAHSLFASVNLSVSQLATTLYKNFIDFVVAKTKDPCSHCFDHKEFLGSLPSVLHLEILLMAYHLSSDSEKGALVNYTLSSLKALNSPPNGYNATQLSSWGLQVSRLLLMVQHFLLYPSTCPSWLLLQWRSILRKTPSKVSNSHSLNTYLASWTSTAMVSIMGDSTKDLPVVSNLLPQLIDFSSADGQGGHACQNFDLDSNECFLSFTWILGFWEGNKAEALEDLIIERYIFLLCWNTCSVISSAVNYTHATFIGSHKLDKLDTKSFFLLRHWLLGNTGNDADLPAIIFKLLHGLYSTQKSVIVDRGWDFLRNGSWLSVLLALLSSGIQVYNARSNICEAEPYWIENSNKDKRLLDLAENLMKIVVQDNHVEWLVNILLSCLKINYEAFQEAFLWVLDNKQCHRCGFSPLLLLKHMLFNRSRQDELIAKICSSSSKLESVFCLPSKLDEISKKSTGLNLFTLTTLLHGFPSHTDISSAILVSCLINVRDIISTLGHLLKFNSVEHVNLGKETVHLLLDLVMAVKSDRTFATIHETCVTICSYLGAPFVENSDYSYLFQLKHIEGFLKDMNSQDINDQIIHEMLVSDFIDFVEYLKSENSKAEIYKFYLSSGMVNEDEKQLFSHQRADILVVIDALDKCHSAVVNIKVLTFFVNLLSGAIPCSDLGEKVLGKFNSMDLTLLSKWVEIRLLGNTVESVEKVVTASGISSSLQESTKSFITCLLSQPCDVLSKEFHGHLIKAMLISLDTAFLFHDVYAAKSYFNFIVQLLNGNAMIKQLLEKVILLMQKLADSERSQQALKFLFDFLRAILSECGGQGSIADKVSRKLLSNSSVETVESRQVGSRKNTEALALSPTQEAGSASVDCDVASVDEDEDDGTSEGELASIDKEEDEDTDSEKTLASKVCTFTSSGSNFMEQHWYFCYTCDLTVSKGCCSICAKVCHRGHRVVYSRSSRFFCDCGAGGVRGSSCQCLKPRKYTGGSSSSCAPVHASSTSQPFLPFLEDGDHTPYSDSDLDDDACADIDGLFKLTIPKEVKDEIATLLEDLCMEGQVIRVCDKLLPIVIERQDSNIFKDRKVSLQGDKVLSVNTDMFQLKKVYKNGSFDLKIRADYSNSRELKAHLNSGSLMKSALSISSRGRLAAGEGDKVAIFDVAQVIGQSTVVPVTADKSTIKPLSKNIVRFEIVHIIFNPIMENYLLVAGYEDCQVLTVSSRGEVTDRLAIELALQGAYIRRVDWVPGSQVQLLVVSNLFVKIYDLSQDNISPLHYFTVADDSIMDATLISAPMGRLFLLVLSELGNLYKHELSLKGDVGAKLLKEVVEVPGRAIHAKGHSLHFSPSYRLLFLSYQDGTNFIGHFDIKAMLLTEISALYESEHDGNLRPVALHHWKDLLVDCGLLICFSTVKQNTAFSVIMGLHELFAHNLRHASASPLVGIAAYKALSKDKAHCLVLHEDGSLQIYSHMLAGLDSSPSVSSDRAKKIEAGILSSKAYSAAKPEFPLDFFEKTTCITSDVKFTSESIRNSDPEGMKHKLDSDDGFLESANPAGFKITVVNSNSDVVMVGIRLHVGNTSASHIPSEIRIFQRVIKLDEGMRSWYDIPFTTAEALLADEEFTVSVGPAFNGSVAPRLDSLEVYGRAKDEFGWKEKMDAVLDMEADVLGSSSTIRGMKKMRRAAKTSPIEEQLLADALKLLSKFYSLCRPYSCLEVEEANVHLTKLKCKNILELIFQNNRGPYLQSAACHVLQALFPKREIYYHVKDTMRLIGVMGSCSTLSSRVVAGSGATAWVIKEFAAKTRVVSKIALLRKSNLAAFLEAHGSKIVDGLMQVFWGILDLEQPDTQTINSIVIPCVELIYSYAECLAFHGPGASGYTVVPAVNLFRKLLFAPYESVRTCSSLAISSRLLQVPFPKQKMLGIDEGSESIAAVHLRADMSSVAGRNAQLVIEEDSNTSSVQYCCDGCSTVPILRRRWHCNVCPDFDLCEACYEVMDSDRLPPPHSIDHQMSAIPIEIDTVGGDNSEIQFSIHELHDTNLVPSSTDTSLQGTSSTSHVLESSETGEFPVSVADHRIVSISASKRAVNSLLLHELIEELKGWMDETSGDQAIPVMQLFYRLSSAVGGPFMDSSKPENLDLEKLVKWFLDELNLEKPFVVRHRTFFGEVAILVFMFLTLMLRNWHQPGGDSSSQVKSALVTEMQDKCPVNVPASTSADRDRDVFSRQLVRSCSYLRQQPFVNYLMDILQQLIPHFKSSHVSVEGGQTLPSNSGCGSLLTVRREFPAGNFSPFFSDSFAKAHHSDLFVDFHKLLLENTFRLVYSLVRPEKHDKSTEKDKQYKVSSSKDIKLDGFQDILCSYLSNPHTLFVRRFARRLFLHFCGSKTHYYSLRDSWQLSNEVKKFYKLVTKSGGFQDIIPYERSVKLVKCLSAIAEIAGVRPRNWQKYCLKHGDVLSFMMEGIFSFGEETVIQTLKLLNLALYTGKDMTHSMQKSDSYDAGTSSSKSGSQSVESKKKRRGEDGNEGNIEKCLDMEQAVEIFSQKDGNVLGNFIDKFLLEWNSSSVRTEAKGVLYGSWHHGKLSFQENLLTVLLQKIKFLPLYGQNIVEFIELLILFLGKVRDSAKQEETELITRCLTSDVIGCIFETLHSQNELLANHPNSRIYNTLSSLVEFDGYYLESEPCVSCSCPEVPYSRTKLETLKFETKFTDNRIIVKCTGSYTIQSMIMNVHDVKKSKSVKLLNLYYNNRPVSDLSELKNNWPMWKRAKSCHLAFNQTEVKVEFPIPITACNFMIELDSFYENLQASSLESLQCPRCSRSVTDKHGICSNCHENAYQCRQCRNINYENLDSFLCNECGYSKYGRFEFNFMARPSFLFDRMENDEDMKKGLLAIESESENAHRRYQQLMGFKKPLLKLVSSIGEHEIDSQQKDTVQQMMVSLPGPSCKINRKIALLGVLYGEKCKAAFDSVSKSVQTLQGLRRVLMCYLEEKKSGRVSNSTRFAVPRSSKNCYGCATTFVTQCMELLQALSKHSICKKQLVASGILSELFGNNIHQGPKAARIQARSVLCAFTEGDSNALAELNSLIQKKVIYCLEHHRSLDIALATREELLLLSEVCAVVDEFWEARLRVAFQLFFASIRHGGKNPSISEHIILPCLRILSQACAPLKPDTFEKDQAVGKPVMSQSKSDDSKHSSLSGHSIGNNYVETSDRNLDISRKDQEISLLSYYEWEKGASYLDFVRRKYKIAQTFKASSQRLYQGSHRSDYLALKYGITWKRVCCKKAAKNDFSTFELGSWISELILSPCSQSIRAEVSALVSSICPPNSFRRFQLLSLLMLLLPATLAVGESAAEYFELFFKMVDSDVTRLFLTSRGCLASICRLITQEVSNIESREMSLNIDISQGFILHKLVELLSKFLEVPSIRCRFMREELLAEVLESLLVIRGLIVQKTKLIIDCNQLLKDLLDSLLVESCEHKRQFIRACISGLQVHGKEKKGRTCLFILEQLCNMICPSKPEPVYLLVLNKAHTQEEFIRGSMTKNPYSSTEIGPLMRDVKNKICHQLDLLGLVDDDYGMELLVAGNIISLDLSISQVYEQVWKKSQNQMQNTLANAALLSSSGLTSARDCPPMTITYRLQGLDGEATEPMIKELDEEREESQDPEVEFAISGAVREFGGLEIMLNMIQQLRDDELKTNQEELSSVLNLLMYCCKIRENRRSLLQLGALGMLLETARHAFSVDAMEPAEGILLIVESLTMEANENDVGITQSVLTVGSEETGAGDQAKKIVLMFLDRLCHSSGPKKSNKQQRNNEMVTRILPYLTYGEPAAMEVLVQHFDPYLHDWAVYDLLQKKYQDNPRDDSLVQKAGKQKSEVENFVRVSESLNTSSCGERLKDIILERGIVEVAVSHLRECFMFMGQSGFKTSVEWQKALALPSVPLILSMLRGLSRGHLATQKCIDEGEILPLLHALEGVSGESGIGARAENLLDALSDKENNGDGFLGEKVLKLRHATRNEMRQRALRKREELLQGLGMRQELASDGGERIIVAQPAIEGLEDVEEEMDGLACMVCREGYTLRPSDMLGVYSFSKRVNLVAGSTGISRGDCVYTTVSHFNVIHFQCHQEAKRADAALKSPKKEWEGATLRNNETLCNSIFPLRGPSVPLSQYIRCVDQYWDNLNSLGRADGSRLRLITYDIVLMLARFATGASFSTDSKGGGKESNSRLLPFMIQMACHVLDQGNPGQQRRSISKSVSMYLSSSTAGPDSSVKSSSSLSIGRPGSDDTVQFMMVNSLLSESYDEWCRHMPLFLQRGIHHAYMQHIHGRSTLRLSSESGGSTVKEGESSGVQAQLTDSGNIFPIIQPMLVYTGLIEQLQRFFKVSRSSSSVRTPKDVDGDKRGSSSDANLEKWEVLMREGLVNMKEMLGLSKELLSWLEDMTTAVDLQEAFDVMGALAAAISGGFSTCEEFVRAAIDSGKN